MVLFTLLFDQLTKFFALQSLSADTSLPVIKGFFHLTLVRNPGIAFGFFQSHQNFLTVLISASLVVLIFIAHRMYGADSAAASGGDKPTMARLSLALILGGAIGNWIDRLRFQAVIDFLDFRVWPVFNVADSAITIGVALYVVLLIRGGGRTT